MLLSFYISFNSSIFIVLSAVGISDFNYTFSAAKQIHSNYGNLKQKEMQEKQSILTLLTVCFVSFFGK